MIGGNLTAELARVGVLKISEARHFAGMVSVQNTSFLLDTPWDLGCKHYIY